MPRVLGGLRVPGSGRARLEGEAMLEVRVESETNPRASTPNVSVSESAGWVYDKESLTWRLALGWVGGG